MRGLPVRCRPATEIGGRRQVSPTFAARPADDSEQQCPAQHEQHAYRDPRRSAGAGLAKPRTSLDWRPVPFDPSPDRRRHRFTACTSATRNVTGALRDRSPRPPPTPMFEVHVTCHVTVTEPRYTSPACAADERRNVYEHVGEG